MDLEKLNELSTQTSTQRKQISISGKILIGLTGDLAKGKTCLNVSYTN